MKKNQFKRGMSVMLSVPWREGLTPATFLKIVHGKALFQLDIPFTDKGVPIVECDIADIDLLGHMVEATKKDLWN